VKVYNWEDALNLCEQVAKSYLNQGLLEKTANTYKKLGYFNSDLYNQIGNQSKLLECKAEENFAKGMIAKSIQDVKNAFTKSYALFVKSSELYLIEENPVNIARIRSRFSWFLQFSSMFWNTREESKLYTQIATEVSDRAWKASKKIGNLQFMAESLAAKVILSQYCNFVAPFMWDHHWKEHYRKLLFECDELINLLKDFNDFRVLAIGYFTSGYTYSFYASHYVEDDWDRRDLFDRGLESLEKALEFFPSNF
jgi:hypothetical protein